MNARQDIISVHQNTHTDLDIMISAWLDEKVKHTDSTKTEDAYTDAIASFRSVLQSAKLDLDSDASLVAMTAQGWAGQGKRGSVAPATFNQRLAIISSFFDYAIKHERLVRNPIATVSRRKGDTKESALPLDTEEVKLRLQAIDKKTPQGLRDYVLLSLLFATGRRVSELANLRYGDIHFSGNKVLVTFKRCKGNKTMKDELPAKLTQTLKRYLQTIYNTDDLTTLAQDAAIWISFSLQNKGKAISTQTIADICESYLGTSKVHATRHTFALMMEEQGAKLSDIGARLGHNNLKTTSDYMTRLHSHTNAYAQSIEDALGIE